MSSTFDNNQPLTYANPRGPKLQTQYELTDRLKKIVQAYNDAGVRYYKTPDDDREIRFNHIAKKRPDTVKKYVVWVVRVKGPTVSKKDKNKEYLIYYQHQTASAFNDQEEQFSNTVGYYSIPKTKVIRNVEGEVDEVRNVGNEFVYEIPYSKETLKKLLDESETEVTQFHLAHGAHSGDSWVGNNGKLYSIHNVDDFLNGSFNELWEMSEYGYSTAEASLEAWRENQKQLKETIRAQRLQQKALKV